MTQKKRYPVANGMRALSKVLGVDEARVLRRAGFSPDFLVHASKGVTAQEFYGLWDAAFAEVGDPNIALEAAVAYAHGPYIPAVLAFSCSPNTEIGLTRLSLFKPLVAPIALDVRRTGGTLEIDISSSDPDVPMPASASCFELVYFLECTRRFTFEHIVPLAVHGPVDHQDLGSLEGFFGVPVTPAPQARITLSLEDAHRPLMSQNDAFWETLEIDLKRQMAEREAPASVADRVHRTLVDMLPAGDVTVDAVCKRLGMSKRSLQRHLQSETASFQSILDATRAELSMRYLAKGDMSVEEISYLLAYRDPNSFYRAFHGWTGMTPAEARGQVLQ